MLKFIKKGRDYSWEMLKFIKKSSDFIREVLKFMKFNDCSRDVLKFVKTSSQKCWGYDKSQNNSSKD